MSKLGKRRSRWKVQRALLCDLPGLGKAGALERRNYPPGQHGQMRRKFSEYALRLREKQKILFHYGLREEQLRRFVARAKRGRSSDWMDTLIGDLESRIDSLVFRLGFASSIPAARQMVCHGHVLVDGKKLTIPSALVKPGQKITLTERAYATTAYLYASKAPRLMLADFLAKEAAGAQGQEAGILKTKPGVQDAPFDLAKNLVTEFYAKI